MILGLSILIKIPTKGICAIWGQVVFSEGKNKYIY